MTARPYISIHIPKTAGTALSILFDYGCGRRIYYDYSNLKELLWDSPEGLRTYAQDVEDKRRHKDFLARNFAFIHGHFFYEKYADIFPDARYITCVREPLSRLVSYYHHLMDGSDRALENEEGDLKFYHDIRAGRMDLADLAALPHIGNLQSTYLRGRDIMDYDHVFINEELAESFYQFQLNFGFQRNDPYMNLKGAASIPTFNEKGNRKSQRQTIPKAMLEKAGALLEEDHALYQRAREKFRQQGKLAQESLRKRTEHV